MGLTQLVESPVGCRPPLGREIRGAQWPEDLAPEIWGDSKRGSMHLPSDVDVATSQWVRWDEMRSSPTPQVSDKN